MLGVAYKTTHLTPGVVQSRDELNPLCTNVRIKAKCPTYRVGLPSVCTSGLQHNPGPIPCSPSRQTPKVARDALRAVTTASQLLWNNCLRLTWDLRLYVSQAEHLGFTELNKK